jgi:hypothetical protein
MDDGIPVLEWERITNVDLLAAETKLMTILIVVFFYGMFG